MAQRSAGRFRPRHPRLGALGARIMLPVADLYHRRRHIFRPSSRIAAEKREAMRATLARGEPTYLAGVAIGGLHNTGVALVEIAPGTGPRIICNHEEERFSGRKHTNAYPCNALEALRETMKNSGLAPEKITAWLGTFDYPVSVAVSIGTFLEEVPASFGLRHQDPVAGVNVECVKDALLAPRRLAALFGLQRPVPIIGMPHHDNHAAFAYGVSPFAREREPVMVLVSDGAGDCASISHYVGTAGRMRLISHNGSLFDSLGGFYGIISATQGGWSHLSSEGRYMGAAGYGDMNRATNRYYQPLRNIFSFEPDGLVHLNRALANWHCSTFSNPYTPALIEILGPPIARENMWNPDAVLRVEDLRHRPQTQDRVDKAAATQLVFEDGLFHLVDGFIRRTGSDRLVLSGGAALNALANMHLLERFDEDYYARVLGRRTRLHLWVPPTPGDAGVTLGAAYNFALSAGVSTGPPLQHAFYCGRGFSSAEWLSALREASDVEWIVAGEAGAGLGDIADLMASITAGDGVIGLVQGAAETGPRALGHRSILANACNPRIRELINERVKYRELIRPLAPMATLSAAKDLFELNEGASDDDYNAYNYMVITVRAKPRARRLVPAVIHVDGTARIQIVREETDPVTYAYLKALGARTGAEVAVNTSFNVGAPIAQTPSQVIETLRRAKGMDGAFIFAADGPVLLAWVRPQPNGRAARIHDWFKGGQESAISPPSRQGKRQPQTHRPY